MASESGTFFFAFGPLITIVGLCVLSLVSGVVLKVILCKRKGTEGVAVTALNSPREDHNNYEMIDPIYEVINIDHLSSGTQIMMDNNDAYKTIKSMEKTSYPLEGVDGANNEAYVQMSSELDILPMEHNGSYQEAPFNFISPVVPAGVASACTQEYYDKQSLCNLKQLQQKKSCSDTPMSQNDNFKDTKLQSEDTVLYMCQRS